MATYKLIQDIEAEDHILGPLSLRQFIFALIAAFLFYICFVLVIKLHAPFLLLIFGPPALFCAFFAFPWGGDQPTEIWALAKLRFWFKPRRRVWSQSGVKELVTITVPKKVERVYTNGLSQSEVKSRLQALADTLDSRGWAVKHIDTGEFVPPIAAANSSERLLDLANSPLEVPNDTAQDMLDPNQSLVAQQFESMINKSSQDHRQRLIAQLQSTEPELTQPAGGQSAAQWFMNQAPAPVMAAPSAVPIPAPPVALPAAPVPGAVSPEEALLSSQLKSQAAHEDDAYGNLRTLQPLGSAAAMTPDPTLPSRAQPTDDQNAYGPMTGSNDPAILSLSNNDDLNVATLAREAHKARSKGPQDEVVISLH